MLSTVERNFIFSTLEKCRNAGTAEHLEEIVRFFVGGFIPHKISVCGIGNIGASTHGHRLGFGCAPEMMESLLSTSCATNSFLLPLWKQQREPMYIAISELDERQLNPEQKAWGVLMEQHGVRNIAMHGVLDVAAGMASFFYLGTLAEPLSAHQAEIFSMLVPHLHQVLLRIMQSNPSTTATHEEKSLAGPRQGASRVNWGLTRREAEILKWIYFGKTNSETAKILGISELTVRNHMQNLMLKLGVGNRTQAVVKAMQNNIFSGEPSSLSI
ncbi:MAG TPA: LuxR C-terminal-related transcriptional regulator [Burkholderiaceae bacterium]|jgi:transcriptional regulator EpsA|nr:LuxR C-terminal-related transcriptional regulator [Burkholderiaceae bacterium]